MPQQSDYFTSERSACSENRSIPRISSNQSGLGRMRSKPQYCKGQSRRNDRIALVDFGDQLRHRSPSRAPARLCSARQGRHLRRRGTRRASPTARDSAKHVALPPLDAMWRRKSVRHHDILETQRARLSRDLRRPQPARRFPPGTAA